MDFDEGAIEGVEICYLTTHGDERGSLIEVFRSDEISGKVMPVMGYVSITKPGKLRGPHEHKEQVDVFCFIGPSTFRLVLWDNRIESPTYDNKITLDIGEDQPARVIVPKGVVHGYRNIGTKDGTVFNFPNRLYNSEDVDEIRHEADPDNRYLKGL